MSQGLTSVYAQKRILKGATKMEQIQEANLITLKVAAASNPSKVATSIFKNLQEGRTVETLSIGAGASNQALKGIIIARSLAASAGWDLLILPGFIDLTIDMEKKTAIKMAIVKR